MSTKTPLSLLELLFLFPTQLETGNSCDILVLNGKIDNTLFEQAVELLSSRHPLLNHRMERKLWQYNWVPISDDVPFDIRYFQAGSDDEETLVRELVERVWQEKIDIKSERVVRFYITESRTKTYIQIISHHVCADATACALLASDLAECYGAVKDNRLPVPVHGTKHMINSSKDIESRLSFRERCVLFLKSLVLVVHHAIKNNYKQAIPTANPGDKSTVNLKKVNLGSTMLSDLKAVSKARSTTLHPLLLTALARAKDEYLAARNIENKVLTYADLYSLRSLATNDMSRVYNSMVMLYIRHIDSTQSDDEIIAGLNAELRPANKYDVYVHYFTLKLVNLSRVLSTALQNRISASLFNSSIPTNLSFTNPGVLRYPLEKFGDQDIVDYYTFPFLYGPMRITFLANCFHNNLNITCIYDETAFSERDIDELLERYIARLNGMTTAVAEQKEVPAPLLNAECA